MTANELKGRPRRTICAQVRMEESHCGLCGGWIDKTLPKGHRLSFTVDEIIPRSLHPMGPRYAALTRSNLRAAHWSCNSSKGNGTRVKRTVVAIRSRVW